MASRVKSGWRRVSDGPLGTAVVIAYQSRTTGLAAEASFWAIFALPWLILGLVAGISRVQGPLGLDTLEQFRDGVLRLASEVLTPEAIDDLLVPLLDSLLGRGQATLGIIGVVIAVWAGSRVVDALVNAMTIVYQREGLRGFVHSKLLSVGVYVGGLALLIVAIPLILAGPAFVVRSLPGVQGSTLPVIVALVEVVVVLLLLVSLYHWSVPHRTSWSADIPGALIALGLWAALSWALRWYFSWIFREGSVYGAIAAPVAVMYWVYVSVLSLMLGAAFNGALAIRRGWVTVGADPAPPTPAADPDAPPTAKDLAE